jgi:DNA-binding CsgD family transcriptional regulator
MTTATTRERHANAISDACKNAEDGLELFAEVSERLRRVLPFDGAAWFATDPSTVLASCPVQVQNVDDGHCESYWERECQVEDAMLFRDLARAPIPAATLYETTANSPERSARYREFLAPQGYGDELRAAFRLGTSTWGVVDLFRDKGGRSFSVDDLHTVQAIAPAVASALRGFATASAPAASDVEGPGTVLFDQSGSISSMDDNAERWFVELAGPGWASAPTPVDLTSVYAVVSRAQAIQAGTDRGPASSRVRTPSGRWLLIHASCLKRPDGRPGPVAVHIEPAKSAQIAPIIVEAYCLTPREQQITQALARGLSNLEIAREMFLSAHTVRDHLKAIFAKVGVASRGELVAKLFAEHYGPATHAPGAATAHVPF